MISYIKGTLERRAESYIIIETGGIGYRIFVSSATLANCLRQVRKRRFIPTSV